VQQGLASTMPEPEDFIGVRTLSSKQQIFSILNAVQKARTPIMIKFEGIERYFTSLILRTDLDEGYLIIDEIAPESGHEMALQGRSFSIRGSHHGVSLYFRPNVVVGSGIENDIAFYKINFPQEMIYQQRRTAYRAPVPLGLDIQAKLVSPHHGTLSGILYDISTGGCRLNFKGNLDPEFARGDLIDNFQLILNDGEKLSCPVQVCHSQFVRDWKQTTCGLQFVDLDKLSIKKIDRFVYFLQREARRLQPI